MRNIPMSVWIIAVVSLIVRLALVWLNKAEYTDGVIQLELLQSPVVFFPPGYSTAVWSINGILGNLLYSGRITSVLAATGSVVVCFLLAKRILSHERTAVIAALLLTLSPIFNRWSIRVMTDSLFLLVFLICCLQYMNLLANPKKSPVRFLGWIGIACLVRYQGLFFIPFFLYLLWTRRSAIKDSGIGRQLIPTLVSLLPWFLLGFWISVRGFGHAQQFIDRGSYGFWLTFSLYFGMFETYLLYWPWVMTYGTFILGCCGIVLISRNNGLEKRFAFFMLITALVFLLVHSCFLSFQYRYLLPLVPLWCIAAARGWIEMELRIPRRYINLLKILIITNMVVMSTAVLYFQRTAFGDIADSARFINTAKFKRMVEDDSRILSDEIYRQGVYNVKMKFWAGQGAEFHFYPMTEPKVGDIVILHNTYSDLAKEKKRLEEKFDLSIMQTWYSNNIWGDYTALPLLPDIMVNPPDVSLTSNPPCMAFRFAPQTYYSVALMLKDKRTPESK